MSRDSHNANASTATLTNTASVAPTELADRNSRTDSEPPSFAVMAALVALPFGLLVAASYPLPAALVLSAVAGACTQRAYDARTADGDLTANGARTADERIRAGESASARQSTSA